MGTMHYLYGIIAESDQQPLSENGLSGAALQSFSTEGLTAIFSELDLMGQPNVTGSRRNMIAHQKAVEHIMAFASIVPFSFGTVVNGEKELSELLSLKKDNFNEALAFIDGKIELGLKVFWNDMPFIYKEITEESEKIKQLKARIESTGNQSALIEIGKLVEDALLVKKDTEAAAIMEILSSGALDYQVNPNISDAMLLNASFFIKKSEEKNFDALVEQAANKLAERASFKYVGPLAPYSFLKLNLSLETQE